MAREDHCAACGTPAPIEQLDAKPENRSRWRRYVAQHGQRDALSYAANAGLQFTRLECAACYGPGYSTGAL